MLILNIIQPLIWKEWIAHYVVFRIWKSSLSRHIQQVRPTFHYLCIWQNPRWRILTNRCSFIMHASLTLMRCPPPPFFASLQKFLHCTSFQGLWGCRGVPPPWVICDTKAEIKRSSVKGSCNRIASLGWGLINNI